MVVNEPKITEIERLDVPEAAVVVAGVADAAHCQGNCYTCDKIDPAE